MIYEFLYRLLYALFVFTLGYVLGFWLGEEYATERSEAANRDILARIREAGGR